MRFEPHNLRLLDKNNKVIPGLYIITSATGSGQLLVQYNNSEYLNNQTYKFDAFSGQFNFPWDDYYFPNQEAALEAIKQTEEFKNE